jgi:outer membrane lipoprotein-sorting protein
VVKMKLIPFGMIIIILLQIQAFSTDKASIMEGVIKNYSAFNSIQASIVQHIFNPDKSYIKMTGDYCATGSGLMRIDYIFPSRQIVVNNRRGLFWYYPESEIVYSAESGDMKNESLPVFLKRVYEEGGDLFRLTYRGKRFYGFFSRAHIFDIKLKNNNTFRVWVDNEGKYVLRKYLLDSSGREIVKELYSDYKEIDGIFVPSVIEVRARTSGGTVRTLTEYSNIIINKKINPSYFNFQIKQNMQVRSFDGN